jgi:2-oxo-4-hydroxy-4-carboxy-5-ureidoimidazoline decarboxylase
VSGPASPSPPLLLAAANRLDRDAFARALSPAVERSPWVVERAWAARPFATVDALHAALAAVVRAAPREEQLALLRAHPDLAGKAARAGELTAASATEQASAGLDRLSAADHERFDRLNRAYRARFGFPFIVAVRRHTLGSILAAFEERLAHAPDQEIEAALEEVLSIVRLRLDTLIAG